MPEKKAQVVGEIGKELSGMTKQQRAYLIGFLEGFAANVGNGQLSAQRPGA